MQLSHEVFYILTCQSIYITAAADKSSARALRYESEIIFIIIFFLFSIDERVVLIEMRFKTLSPIASAN